jgi:phage baseplate assembly protein W
MANEIYKDINQFSPSVRPFATEAQAVYQSVFNLLRIRRGESVFRPERGIDLEAKLFDLDDDATEFEVLDLIVATVQDNEPRVKVDVAQSFVRFIDAEHRLELALVFEIQGLEGQFYRIEETFGG